MSCGISAHLTGPCQCRQADVRRALRSTGGEERAPHRRGVRAMPQNQVASGACDRHVNPADGVGSLTNGSRTHPAHAEGHLEYGSSEGSVRLRPVYVVDKPSIVSDLRGWITPSASGEELQAPGKVRPTLDGGIARAGQFQGAEQSARVRRSGRTSAKVEATFHGVSWFVAL